MSTPTPRLTVDFELTRPGLTMAVKLAVGTEILVLFGASGVGKTTTLQVIAGLTRPSAGEITFDGTLFFRRHRPGLSVNRPTRLRQIGFVFQQYALFPHLNAWENVAYALWRQPDRRARATDWLDRLGIAHLATRLPVELSGGQQQRVAIARALIAGPRLLLLDEPFTALDMAVRERLQQDLARLQSDLGLVVVYVTHRLEDAFAVGDRLAIMRDGQIEQIGPIATVTGQPANPAIASILGIRNLFTARVIGHTPAGVLLDWSGLTVTAAPQTVVAGATVSAYIRPEEVKFLYPDRPVMRAVSLNILDGTVVANRRVAHERRLRVQLSANQQEIEVAAPLSAYLELSLEPGSPVQLSLRPSGLVILHDTTGPG